MHSPRAHTCRLSNRFLLQTPEQHVSRSCGQLKRKPAACTRHSLLLLLTLLLLFCPYLPLCSPRDLSAADVECGIPLRERNAAAVPPASSRRAQASFRRNHSGAADDEDVADREERGALLLHRCIYLFCPLVSSILLYFLVTRLLHSH